MCALLRSVRKQKPISRNRPKPSQIDERRALVLVVSMVATFVIFRVALYFAPDTDLDVGAYNVHHLFTGLLLITFCGLAVALFSGASRVLDAATAGFGIGLGLALDEWVYLIVTDGSNASYLLPVSFWGGVVLVGLACAFVFVLWRISDARRQR